MYLSVYKTFVVGTVFAMMVLYSWTDAYGCGRPVPVPRLPLPVGMAGCRMSTPGAGSVHYKSACPGVRL